jgi:predicted dehydrogenase
MNVRLGLIGFGRHLRRYLLPNIIGAERLRIQAVAEPQPDLRAEAADRLAGVTTFADGAELMASGLVDAVVISTGPDSHVPLAAEALRHGLHVFVEKPLGTNGDDVRVLAREAAGRGLVGMNGMMWRWAPATTVLGRWLTNRTTDLMTVTVTLPRIDLRPAWRGDWRLGLLETAFYDAFIHPVDWATLFLNPVVGVHTTVVAADEERGRVVATVRLRDTTGSACVLSMVTGSAAYQVGAWGDLTDGGLWDVDTLQRITVTEQPTWTGTPGGMRDRATLRWEPGQLYRGWGRQGYAEEFTAFADAVLDGGPADNFAAVAHTLDVLAAAIRSVHEGAEVSVEPVLAGS